MKIEKLYPSAMYGAECYLLSDNGHAMVVDPAVPAESILTQVKQRGLTLDGVLLTHGHFDHIIFVDALRLAQPGLPVMIHEGDAPMLEDGNKNAYTFFFGKPMAYTPADRLLREGDVIHIGQTDLTVLHTPGHSPGSVVYLDAADGILITGDTLFADNIGRSDLWNGDFAILRQSLGRLNGLDHSLIIYPGHGNPATLGAALRRVQMFLP